MVTKERSAEGRENARRAKRENSEDLTGGGRQRRESAEKKRESRGS
jgi:hypothetical protein